MADEDKALNNPAGEETSQPTTPVEETKTTEEVTPEEQVQTPTEEQKQDDSSLKKGANARIRELNEAKKIAEEKAQSLEQKLAEFTRPIVPNEVRHQFQPQIQPGAEVTREQYEQDVMRRADSLVQLRLQQDRIINNINREAGESVRAYPQLDPDSKEFDRDLSDSVTEAALAYAQSNPTGSVKKFVDKLMKPYNRAVTKEVGKQSENLAKQVSESALKPTQMTKGEKSFKDLSIAEMEAKLGVVHS
jgi:hypothetical protein